MTAPHILVMTPCYGGKVSAHYTASLIDLALACEERTIPLSWDLRDGGSDIAVARAGCVADFLDDPKPTHLLFIDADIGFATEQVFRLLGFDVEFAAAAYPIKMLDWELIRRAVIAGEPSIAGAFRYALGWNGIEEIVARDGFTRIPYVGIGFTLLRRSALAALSAADPPSSRPHPGLLDCMIDPDTGQYLSECFALCRRWAALGGEIWLDVESRLTHVGPLAFRGDLMAQLEPEPLNSPMQRK
jgi:hypothetical protein